MCVYGFIPDSHKFCIHHTAHHSMKSTRSLGVVVGVLRPSLAHEHSWLLAQCLFGMRVVVPLAQCLVGVGVVEVEIVGAGGPHRRAGDPHRQQHGRSQFPKPVESQESSCLARHTGHPWGGTGPWTQVECCLSSGSEGCRWGPRTHHFVVAVAQAYPSLTRHMVRTHTGWTLACVLLTGNAPSCATFLNWPDHQ